MTTKDAGSRTALNANDLVEHDFFPNVRIGATPEPPAMDQKVADVLSRWAGIVEIVPRHVQAPPCTTRYGTVFVNYDGRVAVNWCTGDRDEHLFDAKTGQCIESSDGRMKDWRIAPWEMHRFNEQDARKYVAACEAGGMSVGTASREDQDFIARNATENAPVSAVGDTESRERKDIQANPNPLWNIERHDKPTRPRTRSILFVSTHYPSGSFDFDDANNVHQSMRSIALARGLINVEDICEYTTMGGSLPGRTFDVIITSDDWLVNILPRDVGASEWWNSTIVSRRASNCITHFLNTHEVRMGRLVKPHA